MEYNTYDEDLIKKAFFQLFLTDERSDSVRIDTNIKLIDLSHNKDYENNPTEGWNVRITEKGKDYNPWKDVRNCNFDYLYDACMFIFILFPKKERNYYFEEFSKLLKKEKEKIEKQKEEEKLEDEEILKDTFNQLMDIFGINYITFDLDKKDAGYYLSKENGRWYYSSPNLYFKYGYDDLYDLCLYAFRSFVKEENIAFYCEDNFKALYEAEKAKRKAEKELNEIKGNAKKMK